MPKTCAYYLVWKGQELYSWHPLISGTSNSVHDANVSVQNKTIAEFEVNEDEWEDYLWEEEANKTDINDQSKYLADQRVEVLKNLN